ncbi:MAG: hypothetical protein U0271_48760 [Polyangiaceae bacterium]
MSVIGTRPAYHARSIDDQREENAALRAGRSSRKDGGRAADTISLRETIGGLGRRISQGGTLSDEAHEDGTANCLE